MDDWKYSARADQMRQIEQDDPLKAAGVDPHHPAPGPRPKSSEYPLTSEMRRWLKQKRRRSKMWILAVVALLLLVALVSLIGAFGSGVDGNGLALGFVGYAAGVATIGFGLRRLLQSDGRRGTYTVEEGWIGTRIQIHQSTATYSRIPEYMINVGGASRRSAR